MEHPPLVWLSKNEKKNCVSFKIFVGSFASIHEITLVHKILAGMLISQYHTFAPKLSKSPNYH